jgi:hypothetical protein
MWRMEKVGMKCTFEDAQELAKQVIDLTWRNNPTTNTLKER